MMKARLVTKRLRLAESVYGRLQCSDKSQLTTQMFSSNKDDWNQVGRFYQLKLISVRTTPAEYQSVCISPHCPLSLLPVIWEGHLKCS